MRFARLIFVCLSLILLLLTAFLSLLRQHEAQPQWIVFQATEPNFQGIIYRMKPDGSQQEKIATFGNEIYLYEISPDGQWILFSAFPYLMRISINSQRQNKTYNDEVYNTYAQWSFDGKWIIFQSDATGNIEVYRTRPDGTFSENITNDPANDISFRVSPRENRIVFVSDRGPSGYEIYGVDTDGSNLVNLTMNTDSDVTPSWSPDGKWILFSSDREGDYSFYKMLNDGTSITKIPELPEIVSELQWSPDGNWILFNANLNGNNEIYKIRSNGTELTNLTENPENDRNAKWSPDGRWITFVSIRNNKYGIYKMRSDGSKVTFLASSKTHAPNPHWSPIINMCWKAEQLLAASFVLFGISLYKFAR